MANYSKATQVGRVLRGSGGSLVIFVRDNSFNLNNSPFQRAFDFEIWCKGTKVFRGWMTIAVFRSLLFPIVPDLSWKGAL